MRELDPHVEQEKDRAWEQLPTSIRDRVQDGAYYSCNWFEDLFEQLRYAARMAYGTEAWRRNPARAYLTELREQLALMEESIDELRDDTMLDPDRW